MSKVIPPEVKNKAIEIASTELENYSETEPTTKFGKIIRRVSRILGRIIPVFKKTI